MGNIVLKMNLIMEKKYILLEFQDLKMIKVNISPYLWLMLFWYYSSM